MGGTISITSDPWAYTNPDGFKVVGTQATIKINPSQWNGDSTGSQAQTLIHELGHVFNMLKGAGGSDFVDDVNPDGSPNAAGQAKNAKIVQDCVRNP